MWLMFSFCGWFVKKQREAQISMCKSVIILCDSDQKNPLSFTVQPVFAVGIIRTITNTNANYYTFSGRVHWEQCIPLFQECPDHIHTRAAGVKGLAQEHLGVGNGASNALIDLKTKSNEMERKKKSANSQIFLLSESWRPLLSVTGFCSHPFPPDTESRTTAAQFWHFSLGYY